MRLSLGLSLCHDSVSPTAQPTSVLSLPQMSIAGQLLTESCPMTPSQSPLPRAVFQLGQVGFPAPKLPSYFCTLCLSYTMSGLTQVLCFVHFPNAQGLAQSPSVVGTQQVKAGDMSGCVPIQWEESRGFQRPLNFFLSFFFFLEAVIL